MGNFAEGSKRFAKGVIKTAFSAVAAGLIYGSFIATAGILPLYIGLRGDFQFVGQIASVPYRILHDGVKDMGLGARMMASIVDMSMETRKFEKGFRYMQKPDCK